MEAKYNRGLEFYFRSFIADQYFRKRALVCREGRPLNRPRGLVLEIQSKQSNFVFAKELFRVPNIVLV